jgi:hypothetical protein
VPNASTIRRQIAGTQQLTLAAILGTTVTTTKTAFALNNNGLTGTGGGVVPLAAGVTGLYQGTGQVIWVHAAGTITGGTASSTSVTLELYQVPNSLLPIANTLSGQQTFTNWNAVGTSSTGTLGSVETAGSFSFDAYVQLDAQGNINGSFAANVFGTNTAQAAITPIAGLVGEVDLNFALAITLGGTEAGVVANLDEFSLNLL